MVVRGILDPLTLSLSGHQCILSFPLEGSAHCILAFRTLSIWPFLASSSAPPDHRLALLMLLFPPGMPFPSKPIPPTSPKALLARQCPLITSSEKSSLMFPRAMRESVASSPLPGGTLFHASVITPATPSLHLEQGVCSVSMCWVGRAEGAEKAGSRGLTACESTWKKAVE